MRDGAHCRKRGLPNSQSLRRRGKRERTISLSVVGPVTLLSSPGGPSRQARIF